jgi:hypothetical protein
MGSGSRLASRIFTNSFSGKNREMAFPFKPNNYFGLQSKPQYSYNVYHQLANNGAGFGARGDKWARSKGINFSFIPPASVTR